MGHVREIDFQFLSDSRIKTIKELREWFEYLEAHNSTSVRFDIINYEESNDSTIRLVGCREMTDKEIIEEKIRRKENELEFLKAELNHVSD